MANRFTDTSKWKRPWFQALSRDAKLLWFFLCDDCDHAGIWIADFDLMSLRLGMKVDEKKLRELVGDKLIKIDADKYFIPSFFEFQYGNAKDGFKAKQSALKTLRSWNLLDEKDSLRDLANSYLSVSGESPDCHIISKSISNTGDARGENLATDPDYEAVYKTYPKKVGKGNGLEKLKKLCRTKEELELFAKAMNAYVAYCKRTDTFLKQFDTFVNWSWRDCLDPSYGQDVTPSRKDPNAFVKSAPKWSDMAADLWRHLSDGLNIASETKSLVEIIGFDKLQSLHRDDFRPHGIVPGLLKDASERMGAA